MQLTKNFSLAELVASDTATRRGIDNTPGPQIIENLRRTAAALQRVRDVLGQPVIISSGYRCPALNRAIGGSATSAHMQGLAVDFRAPGYGSPAQVCLQIVRAGLVVAENVDQLIEEGTWVHLGLPQPGKKARAQIMTAHFSGGVASYSAGLSRAA